VGGPYAESSNLPGDGSFDRLRSPRRSRPVRVSSRTGTCRRRRSGPSRRDSCRRSAEDNGAGGSCTGSGWTGACGCAAPPNVDGLPGPTVVAEDTPATSDRGTVVIFWDGMVGNCMQACPGEFDWEAAAWSSASAG
jgi:hypothetical protein